MELCGATWPFFLVLAVGCAIASFINVPEPGLMDDFVIIRNKILKTAVPRATAIVRSNVECAKLCTTMHWKCFGANVRRLSTDGCSLLCEAFWVSLPDLSRLEDSVGDLYLNPGRPDYWKGISTGSPTLSTNCVMCLCREQGCEENIGRCFWDYGFPVCGPFALTKSSWCDAKDTTCDDSVEEEFETCTTTMTCSFDTVVKYLTKYEDVCVREGTPVCDNYTVMLTTGPYSCGTSTLNYEVLGRVAQCCSNQGGC